MTAGSARVGVAVGWYDPRNPRVWSGVPRAVVDQVERLASYAGHVDAMPTPVLAKAARRYLRARGRLDDGWVLSRAMRPVAAVTAWQRRLATRRHADGWIELVGSFGRIVGARYITLCELSPSQLLQRPEWWASFGYPGATPAGMAWVARQQLAAHRHAHAVCAASRWAADALVHDGVPARRIHIVGYGANVSMTGPVERDWSQPRFLFVGRDWQRKGGDAVLRAFAKVRARFPAATLDVVGIHPALDGVPGVTGHGPQSLFGDADNEYGRRLLARATCLVVPSRLEPFGIVYVEAARAGLPSIGTTAGGTATSIGDGGVVIDPDDDDALVEAMCALADPGTAADLGARASAHAARLTWDAVGERLLRALDVMPAPSGWAEFL